MDENYRPAPFFDRLGRDSSVEGGAPFYDIVEPARFPDHILRYRNQRWAEKTGLARLSDAGWVNHFAQFDALPENLKRPMAVRYHGHQFRVYNPDIGDGRGFLFAQLRDGAGRLLDLSTKGSGRTPYSRTADGRLTLKGGVREILATEMLEALGVYTSKTFSLIETGEALERHDEPSPTRSAVLVRLSHSHVRFGVFQRLAYERDDEAIAALVDYCIEHFHPEVSALAGEARIVGFFESVVARVARLAAQWMAAGFIHGVLNTDNMVVTGESFDYGPWRFAPIADPNFTAAYFDEMNLYAFGRQAEAAAWNLAQLGGTLANLAQADKLTQALRGFGDAYEKAMADEYFRRLGLQRRGDMDYAVVTELLRWMTASGAPYEQVFFDWFAGPASEARAAQSPARALYERDDFTPVRKALLAQAPERTDRLNHPYFQNTEPCGMLIEEVERIWDAIAQADDWSLLDAKLAAIGEMREAYGFEASRY